ncbi:F-box/FBD/LRR-repeat protein [Raphanus sativus]|nr:F-box/FBD/LRR-repeat protein [Raphanus sativus]
MEKLISGSLLLEDLTLISLSSPKDVEKILHVRSQTLKRIEINFSGEVDIDAPLLQCLRANVNVHKKLKITNSGFSAKAAISFRGFCDHDLIHDIFTDDISRVRDLDISSNTWKVMIGYLKPPLQFCYLSHLHFHLLDTYSGMLPTFLESCPNLESLILELLVGVAAGTKVMVPTVPPCLVSSLKFVEFNDQSRDMKLK